MVKERVAAQETLSCERAERLAVEEKNAAELAAAEERAVQLTRERDAALTQASEELERAFDEREQELVATLKEQAERDARAFEQTQLLETQVQRLEAERDEKELSFLSYSRSNSGELELLENSAAAREQQLEQELAQRKAELASSQRIYE